jgi:hypothetical protein
MRRASQHGFSQRVIRTCAAAQCLRSPSGIARNNRPKSVRLDASISFPPTAGGAILDRT